MNSVRFSMIMRGVVVFALVMVACTGAHALSGSGESAVGVLDTVSPKVTGITVQSENSIEITFSEAMLLPGVMTPENYTLSGPGAGTLSPYPDEVLDSGENVYDLFWVGGWLESGRELTITVSNVQDVAGNPINPSQNSGTYSGGDTGLPLTLWPFVLMFLLAGFVAMYRHRRHLGALLLLVAALLLVMPTTFAAPLADPPEVTNVTFTQSPDGTGGTKVDIYYDLVAPNGPCSIAVSVAFSWDEYQPISSVTGDLWEVGTGTGKHIVWDIRADHSEAHFPQARIRVTAVDQTPGPDGEITILLPGSVALVLLRIPAGTFMMGRYPDEQDSSSSEGPQRQVTLAQDFYMGKYEVTNAQWFAFDDFWISPDYLTRPATDISWNDAKTFVETLNAHVTNTGQGPATFRLPTEAEWEYACRAGTTTRFYFGDSLGCGYQCEDCTAGVLPGNRSDYMWYCGDINMPHMPVGLLLPNAFGLYDMHGNVWEWCEDDWHNNYDGAPTDGSAWVDSPRGFGRMLRSGGMYYDAITCRSAYRAANSPWERYPTIGLRLAR